MSQSLLQQVVPVTPWFPRLRGSRRSQSLLQQVVPVTNPSLEPRPAQSVSIPSSTGRPSNSIGDNKCVLALRVSIPSSTGRPSNDHGRNIVPAFGSQSLLQQVVPVTRFPLINATCTTVSIPSSTGRPSNENRFDVQIYDVSIPSSTGRPSNSMSAEYLPRRSSQSLLQQVVPVTRSH